MHLLIIMHLVLYISICLFGLRDLLLLNNYFICNNGQKGLFKYEVAEPFYLVFSQTTE